MKINLISRKAWVSLVTLAAPCLLPLTANAAELAIVQNEAHPAKAIHKKVELYGSLRLSMDYDKSDVSKAQAKNNPLLTDGAVSISSNTSQIGIRGQVPIDQDYWMLFQYDQQVDIDAVDPGDVLTTRPSFLGLRSPMGTVLVGRINTPFKSIGISYLGYFNTAVGDSHAILGASANGVGRLDLKASNSITWNKDFGSVAVTGQFSADQKGSINTVDNNANETYSGSIIWKPGAVNLAGAFIHYGDAGGLGKVNAYRATAKYAIGPARIGAVYESVKADQNDSMSRDAYGAQLNYTVIPAWTAVAQWNHANASDAGNDSANQYSVGVFHPINRQLLVHAMYTTTRNDGNAVYRGVDYAHGDKLGTLPGHNPQAISVGAQLLF